MVFLVHMESELVGLTKEAKDSEGERKRQQNPKPKYLRGPKIGGATCALEESKR